MFGSWTIFFFKNFGLIMFDLAILIAIVHKLIVGRRGSENEIVYQWIALLALGFTLIYAFIMHLVFAQVTTENMTLPASPFQFEVAIADLAIGVIAILSFRANYSFRLATVIAATCWLWGITIVHIYQMLAKHNFSVSNLGSWMWMDILIPLILIICIVNLREKRKLL